MRKVAAIIIVIIVFVSGIAVGMNTERMVVIEGTPAIEFGQIMPEHGPPMGEWVKVADVNDIEIWKENNLELLAATLGDEAVWLFTGGDGPNFIDLFSHRERKITVQIYKEQDRTIVYKNENGKLWWYIDQDLDGVVDLKLIPGSPKEEHEQLVNTEFKKVENASNKRN